MRIRNLPAGTQEGLLQQAMEKIANVKRVEVFVDLKEAVMELENAAVSQTSFHTHRLRLTYVLVP